MATELKSLSIKPSAIKAFQVKDGKVVVTLHSGRVMTWPHRGNQCTTVTPDGEVLFSLAPHADELDTAVTIGGTTYDAENIATATRALVQLGFPVNGITELVRQWVCKLGGNPSVEEIIQACLSGRDKRQPKADEVRHEAESVKAA